MKILKRPITAASRIPPVPKQARPTSYKARSVNLSTLDGVTTVDILMSKAAAYSFIWSTLNDMNFPPAASQSKLVEYQNGPDYWRESCELWEDETGNFDDDVITHFYARGKLYTIGSDTSFDEALAAFRAAPEVEQLAQSNSWATVLYNGWVFYDAEYDMWYEDTSPPDNHESMEWKNIGGTMIQKDSTLDTGFDLSLTKAEAKLLGDALRQGSDVVREIGFRIPNSGGVVSIPGSELIQLENFLKDEAPVDTRDQQRLFVRIQQEIEDHWRGGQ